MYNNNTIKIARESRGLSQTELAKRLHISQGTLSRFEKGLLKVSDNEIKAIAEQLNYSISLFNADVRSAGETSLFFRKRASLTAKSLSLLESKISILSHFVDELEESVDIPELSIPAVEPSAENTPDEIAFKIRNYLKISQGPVDNIVQILERNGVVVLFIDVDNDKFDGLTMFTSKQIPIIWINKNIPADRKRFSLAHELGHLVMHLRSDDLEKKEKQKEDEANLFAAEFLLPRKECQEDFFQLRYKQLGLKKFYWKVSKAAIIYRAKELGCIDESTARYFFIELGRNGERKNESVNVSIDTPSIVRRMIELHLQELEYSMGELSEITGLSEDDINKHFFIKESVSVKPKVVSL